MRSEFDGGVGEDDADGSCIGADGDETGVADDLAYGTGDEERPGALVCVGLEAC